MDLIFHNGEELYKKLTDNKNIVEVIQKITGLKLDFRQKHILENTVKNNKKEFNVYGDDFKIELIHKNLNDNCCMTIVDYDEDKNFESEINIDFTKNELSQFINLLEIIKNKM